MNISISLFIDGIYRQGKEDRVENMIHIIKVQISWKVFKYEIEQLQMAGEYCCRKIVSIANKMNIAVGKVSRIRREVY